MTCARTDEIFSTGGGRACSQLLGSMGSGNVGPTREEFEFTRCVGKQEAHIIGLPSKCSLQANEFDEHTNSQINPSIQRS